MMMQTILLLNIFALLNHGTNPESVLFIQQTAVEHLLCVKH